MVDVLLAKTITLYKCKWKRVTDQTANFFLPFYISVKVFEFLTHRLKSVKLSISIRKELNPVKFLHSKRAFVIQ